MLDMVLLFINNKNNKSTTAVCSQGHQQIEAADPQPAEQEQGRARVAARSLEQADRRPHLAHKCSDKSNCDVCITSSGKHFYNPE